MGQLTRRELFGWTAGALGAGSLTLASPRQRHGDPTHRQDAAEPSEAQHRRLFLSRLPDGKEEPQARSF